MLALVRYLQDEEKAREYYLSGDISIDGLFVYPKDVVIKLICGRSLLFSTLKNYREK